MFEPQDIVINEELAQLLKNNKIKTICDYGCGTGERIKWINESLDANIKAVGIDCFSKWCSTHKNNAPKNTNNIKFIDNSLDDFNAYVNTNPGYDLVISTFSLHHYKYPNRELKVIDSLINKGGYLYLADLVLFEKEDDILMNTQYYLREFLTGIINSYHRRPYTEEDFKDLIETHLNLKLIKKDIKHFEKSTSEKAQALEEFIKRKEGGIKAIPQYVKHPNIQKLYQLLKEYEINTAKEYSLREPAMLSLLYQKY